MKKCPKCNSSVSETAKFCINCGFNIKKYDEENNSHFCPECGTKFSGGKFCPECGYDVSKELNPSSVKDKKTFKNIDDFDFKDASKLLDEKINKIEISKEFSSFEYEKYGKNGYIIKKYIDLYETNVVIPKSVVAIGESAFEGTYIINVKLNEGIKTIGKRAFANCKHLKKINYPKSLIRIDDEAFYDCTNLSRNIPSSVQILGDNIFGKNKGPEADDYIVLKTASGEEIKFEEIAGINYNKTFYGILRPINVIQGMSSDEALVFKVSRFGDEQKYEIVMDDDIIDAVFKEYYRLLDEK